MSDSSPSKVLVVAFYQFVSVGDTLALRTRLREKVRDMGLRGTILISEEGINCMIGGAEAAVRELIAELYTALEAPLKALPDFKGFPVKESWYDKIPYARMLVKIKKEIIPLGRPDVRPAELTGPRIEPRDLKKWLDEGKDLVLLDTRNEYEIDHGTFKGARRMGLTYFRDFPKKLAEVAPELKGKTVVMFCTGGIRCEKATALAMTDEFKGQFKEVYQLEGGILKYFEECGTEHYDGTCFVFDQRIALTPDSCQAPSV
jgi:UPF0176 protein